MAAHKDGLFAPLAAGVDLVLAGAGERGIWQRRFWEHVSTGSDDLETNIEYVHANPVKHRLVADVDDWPFSSWHRWRRSNLADSGDAPR